ncbi:hypothetical protein JOQ06_013487 [Pogonophryne albipinna]|uniref:Major facilitator superfamily (MFS) profile domain-containing protein n=1 Tax=Pogonophryne albipinna TaxID=1090488 RepID=A0AAD6FS46_9TELE|nr:hypothetical protein JOQ06_013487 [Pogonophryne albipinna]
MKFENVLAEVDGFGKFQLMTIFLMVIPRATLPFHFLMNNFIAVIPSHHCNISSLDDGAVFKNLSQEERLVVGIPVQEDGTPNSCQMFAEPQYHLLLNSSSMTELPTVPCPNGWVYDNNNFKSTLATEWDLVCDKRRMNRATASIFFLGVMFGAAAFGYLSDRFGRKRTLLISYMLTTVFGFASIEWVDIKHRTAVGILMSLDWSIFTALLPVVAYFVNDWRVLTATATSPLILAMITWWWVPESARWLISNRKLKSAHFYLNKCAQINGREQFMAGLKPGVLSETTVLNKETRKYSYLDLIKTPQMRRLTLLTGILWFGVSCTYYGISLNVAGFGVNIFVTQFIYGVIEIPAKIFICFTLNKIGRRMNQAGTLVLTGLCIFCNIFIPQEMTVFRTTVGTLGKMFAEGAFTMVFLYTSELYPTVIRQSGLGYCSFMALTGVSVSPLIMVLEELWLPLPGIVFSLVAFAAGLAISPDI